MKLTPSSNKTIKIVALMSAVGLALPAFATDIDFEGFHGPTVFSSASPIPQIVVTDGVTFTGGVILTDTTELPADETSVYSTADFVPGMSNPITVTDPDGFNNFFFDLLNGEGSLQSFVVADNAGHSEKFDNIPANTQSGSALVGFASTGTVVTITDITSGTSGPFDFFIDNVHFDEALPPSLGGNSVPDGASTAELLAVGALGLVALAYRRRATA